MRLRNAFVVQGNISAALKPALGVPVGDAVAEAQKERDGVGNRVISTCW